MLMGESLYLIKISVLKIFIFQLIFLSSTLEWERQSQDLAKIVLVVKQM